jgi:hypothetical protein
MLRKYESIDEILKEGWAAFAMKTKAGKIGANHHSPKQSS